MTIRDMNQRFRTVPTRMCFLYFIGLILVFFQIVVSKIHATVRVNTVHSIGQAVSAARGPCSQELPIDCAVSELMRRLSPEAIRKGATGQEWTGYLFEPEVPLKVDALYDSAMDTGYEIAIFETSMNCSTRKLSECIPQKLITYRRVESLTYGTNSTQRKDNSTGKLMGTSSFLLLMKIKLHLIPLPALVQRLSQSYCAHIGSICWLKECGKQLMNHSVRCLAILKDFLLKRSCLLKRIYHAEIPCEDLDPSKNFARQFHHLTLNICCPYGGEIAKERMRLLLLVLQNLK